MTPAARTQAAIELLDAIILAAKEGGAAADTLIARYFKDRRYAGSKDRRAVRELVYAAIRKLGERPASGRAAMLTLAADDADVAATFDGSPHGPAPIGEEAVAKRGLVPRWLGERLTASGIARDEQAALVERAPLDVRVNTMVANAAEMVGAFARAETIAHLPAAMRLPAGTNVEAFAGSIEVQDAGSQFVALAADARAGQSVIDLCAGAGGKTLALAAAMSNEGAILATDTDRARLSRLPPRAERAGVTIATTRLLDPGHETTILEDRRASADLVLIDAPCSGTGTWRRNPEARWRLTPARIERLIETQRRLLEIAVPLVKPGGTIAYVVCSLLDEEGAGQIASFLAADRDWRADELVLPVGRRRGPGVRLTPAHDGTDGFFVARLRRAC